MMIFKYHQRNGFALMEAMLSLAIIGLILTTFMMVQTKVFKNVITSSFRIDRFYHIQNMFLDVKMKPLQDEQTVREDIVKDPEVKLRYNKKPINPKSELARFTGLFQEVATGEWHEWGKDKVYDIIRYQFDPPKEEGENEAS